MPEERWGLSEPFRRPSEPFSTGRGCGGSAHRPRGDRGPPDPADRLRRRRTDDRGVLERPASGGRGSDHRQRGPGRTRDGRVPVRLRPSEAAAVDPVRRPPRQHPRGGEPPALVRPPVRLHQPLPPLVRPARLARPMGVPPRAARRARRGPYRGAHRAAPGHYRRPGRAGGRGPDERRADRGRHRPVPPELGPARRHRRARGGRGGAVQALGDRGPGAPGTGLTLRIAGPIPDVEYARQVRTSGDKVELLGEVSEDRLEDVFATADVLVHPSRVELLAGVVLQGLSAGLPVLGADPVADLIPPGTGSAAPATADGKALEEFLAEGVRAYAADPALRRTVGDAARAAAKERYSWPAVVAAHRGIYRRLLDAGLLS